MEKIEIQNKLLELTEREIGLNEIIKELEINEYEILGIVRELREKGINISVKVHDDDIYLFNQGEKENEEDYTYKIDTDKYNEFKDSKERQLMIDGIKYFEVHWKNFKQNILLS